MGVRACVDACRFVKAENHHGQVVDPFCGWEQSWPWPIALGLDAVGVDIAPRMCRRARKLRIELEPRQACAVIEDTSNA